MKRTFGKILATFAVSSLLAISAQADVKLGVIDLRKVFDNYYKTKLADSNLKDEASDLEKQRKDMMEGFQKNQDEWKKMLDKANDQSISTEERTNSKKAAEKKLLELKEQEQTVAQFERSSRAKLGEKQRIKRDGILKEIREVVNAKAKSSGFTVVVDSASSSINDTPVVLYTNGENDLTDAVLKQLNDAAPVSFKSESTK